MATPPVLVAGLTGSGKSTLMLLLSLAMSTPPAALEIHLVDLKNEDLVSLQALPPHARPGQHAGTGRRHHGALFPL